MIAMMLVISAVMALVTFCLAATPSSGLTYRSATAPGLMQAEAPARPGAR